MNQSMTSGFGQFHSNEIDPSNPGKKLTPYGTLTLDGIRALVDNPQQVDKQQAQWLIPSMLPSRNFKQQEQEGQFLMLWADLDKNLLPIEQVHIMVQLGILDRFDFEIYTSRSATKGWQKARILIPLSKTVSGVDWVLCQEVLNDKLQMVGITPDRVSERPAQLCYLPNRGDFYASRSQRDKETFDPLKGWAQEIEQKRDAIKAKQAALEASSKAAKERRAMLMLSDAPDTIGAFNHAYSVQDVLLLAGYTQRGDKFKHPLSVSGSYSASVKNDRVHSLSSNDPLYKGNSGGGGAHDAFSAFRVLFAGNDMNAALRIAGDNWLTINGESYNKAKQREYMQTKGLAEAAQVFATPGAISPVALLTRCIESWPEPSPLPDALPPVQPFDAELLPVALRAWVIDIAHRMQCPADFSAVAALVALSSLIGARAVVRPKELDDWQVVPNLWGVIVGRPGVKKSPALGEVLKPLNVMQATAFELCQAEHDAWVLNSKVAEMQGEANKKAAKRQATKDPAAARALLKPIDTPEEPTARRFIVNDSTVEKLGELLQKNPWGILSYRDELHGLLTSLDKQGQEGSRAFYLQAYDGNQGYTFDRIGRGTVHIPRVCLAMIGSIQPGRIQEYVRGAVSGGGADDGLLQRFGLAVWPDTTEKFIHVDQRPNTIANQAATEVFQRLAQLQPAVDSEPQIWHFDPVAQALFVEWLVPFENELRSDELHPAMVSHLSKYRKLIPALALVFALIDTSNSGGVIGVQELKRALDWEKYLRTHAQRLYAAAVIPETSGAVALLKKIKSGKLANSNCGNVNSFTPREVVQKNWAGLGTTEVVRKAADLLIEYGWLVREIQASGDSMGRGRPSERYLINPAALTKWV